MLHVAIMPAPPTALTAAATARRIVKSITVQYQPSGVVARRLTLDPRTLGKITSAEPSPSHMHVPITEYGSCTIRVSNLVAMCGPPDTESLDLEQNWQILSSLDLNPQSPSCVPIPRLQS